MASNYITFEEWYDKYFAPLKGTSYAYTTENLRAAFNAGRTEARPRVWRYKYNRGGWQIEFLEGPWEGKINGHGEADETDAV